MFNTFHGIATTRVRCTRAHMGVDVGDLGEIVRAEDYCPGLDAGCFTVEPDTSATVNYWTREEMFESWEDA